MANPSLTDLAECRHVVDKLTPDEVEKLNGLLSAALAEQDKIVDRTIDDGLRVLPWPLRVAARKILFGK